MSRIIRPDIPKITKQFAEMRPSGGFSAASIDPCWLYQGFSEEGDEKNANQHYDCMTTEDIASLPVPMLLGKHAAVFLWCTWPMLEHWSVVYRAWGLEYAGLAWEWIKYNPKTGKYAFGPGYGTRKNLEPCLLLTKGNPSLAKPLEFFGVTDARAGSRSVRDFIECMPYDCIRQPRREHSRKPDEAITRIETMFDGPYAELFARTKRKNWKVWGNETEKFAVAA